MLPANQDYHKGMLISNMTQTKYTFELARDSAITHSKLVHGGHEGSV